MLPESTFIPYRNMTEEQAARREAEYTRVMLFGKNLIQDRLIGRWSEGITGAELCKHLYDGVWKDA